MTHDFDALRWQDVVNAALLSRPLKFAKLNHGFWETLVAYEELTTAFPSLTPAEYDAKLNRRFFAETGFVEELLGLLSSWPSVDPYCRLAASLDDYPGGSRNSPRPRVGPHVLSARMSKALRPHTGGEDGLLWKRAAIDGSLQQVFDASRQRGILAVGPSHLARLETLCSGPFENLAIHESEARRDRQQILGSIVARLESDAGRNPVVLLQCGSLSVWLARKLHDVLPNGTVLDVGRALDVIAPEKLMRQPWGMAWSKQIAEAWAPRIPQWQELAEPLVRLRRVRQSTPPKPVAGTVEFVGRKFASEAAVNEILEPSRQQNWWANDGPVCRELEAFIASDLNLPPNRRVVATSSATSAIHALAGLNALRRGRPLRWVGAAYSFPSNCIGPLSGALSIDSDESGTMSVDRLRALPESSYDGVLVTQLFGRSDITAHLDLARRLGKAIIVDAATAYDSKYRERAGWPDEAISFHHTKPWGVGEGGCAIVDAADEDTVRSLIRFGIHLPTDSAPYAMNAKLSDISAAHILAHLLARPIWRGRHIIQSWRISQAARKAGATLLGSVPGETSATPAHVPILFRQPVAPSHFQGLPFVGRKYYRPLADLQRATDIYSRVVCVPSHEGMTSVDFDELCEALATIERRSREAAEGSST